MEPKAPGRRWVYVAAALIACAGALVYCNTFHVPFIFDDVDAIVDNPNIRSLTSLWSVLTPDSRTGLEHRPLVSLSFAINYAVNDLRLPGYHVINLLIHLLAGLALFGIVRRTLMTEELRSSFGPYATPLGLVVALFWVVHPLNTESVTYTFERGECLMGLFFLLTIYCSIRGMGSSAAGWFVAAVVFCALGTATKERAVIAPVIVLLYDRTFVSGSFLGALRRRWGLYVGLALTWAVLGLMMLVGSRSWGIGLGVGMTSMQYARIQAPAVVNYLSLCFWPHPLILDYGRPAPPELSQIVPHIVLLSALVIATVVALVRWPKWGFLGAWIFLILAPSSSFLPEQTPIEEHHMYLPLAGAVVLAVLAVFVAGSAVLRRMEPDERKRATLGRAIGFALAGVCAVALGVTAFVRNNDYGSEVSIWKDTTEKRPGNSRAFLNLGFALTDDNVDAAKPYFLKAADLDPSCASRACYGIGAGYISKQRFDEAIPWLRQAIAIDPRYAITHIQLGFALLNKGLLDEAVASLREGLNYDSHFAIAYDWLGAILTHQQRYAEAVAPLEEAIRLDPRSVRAWGNLAQAYAGVGRFKDAADAGRKAVEMADAAGLKADAQVLRERLKAYEAGVLPKP